MFFFFASLCVIVRGEVVPKTLMSNMEKLYVHGKAAPL
jgi:hypothetical protein